MKDKKEKKVKVIPSVDYNDWKEKYGLKPSMKKSKMKVFPSVDYNDWEEKQKHIRCKCGKVWGTENLKAICTRCQTEVYVRGEVGNKEHKKVKVIPSVDYNDWKEKYGISPSSYEMKKHQYKGYKQSKNKMKKSKMKVKRNLNL